MPKLNHAFSLPLPARANNGANVDAANSHANTKQAQMVTEY